MTMILHFFKCFLTLSVSSAFNCLGQFMLSCYMMSTWNFTESTFEKSPDIKHNSHLNIYFRILDDMALSGGNILLMKKCFETLGKYPKV